MRLPCPLPAVENKGAAVTDWWPMQGHDAQRTSRSSAAGPLTPKLKWTYTLENRLQDNASPIVGTDGAVYQIAEVGLSAIDTDGKLKWTIPNAMRKAPALSLDGTALYALDNIFDNNLQAVDASNDLVSSVAAGNGHSLAIKGGAVFAWGDNDCGQLGDGSTEDQDYPVQVLILNLSNVVAVAGGLGHSLALKQDGTVWAWGCNKYNLVSGILGIGPDEAVLNKPVQVVGLNNVIAISAGRFHSLAVTSDGAVWAWGDNESGKLGDGSNNDRQTPVKVVNLGEVIAVAAGTDHSVALTKYGTVWTWGDNYYGELGDGTNTNSNIPVQVSTLSDVSAIASGAIDVDPHSLAVKSDGTVWAWGQNAFGQLGDGTKTPRNIPVQVKNLTNVDSVQAGGSFYWGNSHSLALKADGTVWAWGSNESGQLGDGTNTERDVPVQVKAMSALIVET